MRMGDNRTMADPTTPPQPGITWAPAEVEDAAALSELFNQIAEHDGTPERLGADTLAHELESAYAPLDERTTVGRTASGRVIAYATVYRRKGESEEERSYVATYVHPEQRHEIDEPLTDWAVEAGLAAIATSSAPRRYVCAWLYKIQEEAAARYRRRSFEPVRHWWEMECRLDDPIPPASEDGFTVVPWGDEYALKIRPVHNSAFADHWGSVPMNEETWEKNMLGSPGFRPELSFVALGDGQIVGYAFNEAYEEDWEAAGQSEAWIGGLGVLRDWRKRGIATALLTKSMSAMRDAGMEAAMIGVDSSSPSGAQHLYQSVGFRTKTMGTTWQKEMV